MPPTTTALLGDRLARDREACAGRCTRRRRTPAEQQARTTPATNRSDRGRRSIALDSTTVEALRRLPDPPARGAAALRRAVPGQRSRRRSRGRQRDQPAAAQLLVRPAVAGCRSPSDTPARRQARLRHGCLGASVPAKIASERLGHARIAITSDTCSHVLPTMRGRPRSKWRSSSSPPDHQRAEPAGVQASAPTSRGPLCPGDRFRLRPPLPVCPVQLSDSCAFGGRRKSGGWMA
jgi:hypothetical protein